MKIKFHHLALLLLLIVAPLPVRAQETAPGEESFSGGVVCTPDVYPAESSDCLPLGPSAYLNNLASLGLTIPPRPLSAYKPSTDLTKIPYRYFHMADDMPPKFYSSLADAQAKSENSLTYAPGFVYVSYQSMDETEHFFLTRSGHWIRGMATASTNFHPFKDSFSAKRLASPSAGPLSRFPSNRPPATGQRTLASNSPRGQLFKSIKQKS
jgi:hypothetical protein